MFLDEYRCELSRGTHLSPRERIKERNKEMIEKIRVIGSFLTQHVRRSPIAFRHAKFVKKLLKKP